MMQNHLLQVLALVTMERPKKGIQGVVDAKNDVLKFVKTLDSSDVCHGQLKGYTNDPDVPNDSKTSTFCMAKLSIDNDRWRDTKFLMSAGKGLDERLCEVRIRFRTACGREHIRHDRDAAVAAVVVAADLAAVGAEQTRAVPDLLTHTSIKPHQQCSGSTVVRRIHGAPNSRGSIAYAAVN